jgi:hypothetical protein
MNFCVYRHTSCRITTIALELQNSLYKTVTSVAYEYAWAYFSFVLLGNLFTAAEHGREFYICILAVVRTYLQKR